MKETESINLANVTLGRVYVGLPLLFACQVKVNYHRQFKVFVLVSV